MPPTWQVAFKRIQNLRFPQTNSLRVFFGVDSIIKNIDCIITKEDVIRLTEINELAAISNIVGKRVYK